jgi:hypothetical protein
MQVYGNIIMYSIQNSNYNFFFNIYLNKNSWPRGILTHGHMWPCVIIHVSIWSRVIIHMATWPRVKNTRVHTAC